VPVSLSPLTLLGNGWVKTFQRQGIHATIEDLLDASFSMLLLSYTRKIGDYFIPELLVPHRRPNSTTRHTVFIVFLQSQLIELRLQKQLTQ
jgi:hypothetical protein